MSQQDDNLFGRLALHYKLVSQEQLQKALRQQSREGGSRKVGDILVEKGHLTPERLQQLLKAQRNYQAKMAAKKATAPTPAAAQASQSAAAAPEDAPATPAAGAATTGARDPAVAPPPPAAVIAAETGLDDIQKLLELAVKSGASDLHIHTGSPLRLRIHGAFETLGSDPVTAEQAERLVSKILPAGLREALDATGQIDFAHTLPGIGRFRANAYRQQKGLDAVFRVIPIEPPSLTELELPLDLARFANHRQGDSLEIAQFAHHDDVGILP